MIQIRQGCFETNSSSCDVYVFDPNQKVSVPLTVELVVGDESTPLNRIFNYYYDWFIYFPQEPDLGHFICTLYKLGVKNIKCSDTKVQEFLKDFDATQYSPSCPSLLLYVLFGKSEYCEVEDYMLDDEYITKHFGEGKEYFAMRTS